MNTITYFSIEPFSWYQISEALICGFLVGLERQIRGKPMGIRTSCLVILGTYIFIAVSKSVNTPLTDPSRIIGQVVTGIGFLGAGVMLTKDGAVKGLTSATIIYVLAALGVCVALAPPFVALKLTVIVVLIVAGVEFLDEYMKKVTSVTKVGVKKISKKVKKKPRKNS